MLEKQFEFKIIKDHDVDAFKKDFDKVDSVKLDLRNNKLHKNKFEELFERLAATRIQYFSMDLSNYENLDEDKFESIVKCLRNWNLKTLILFIPGVKLNDNQFESLFYESLRTMSNLENLYLDMENTNFNKSKMRALERVLPKLENLNNVYINIKNNNILKDDITTISKEIQNIPARELLF